MFNNGTGNFSFPNIGDDLNYSIVPIYEIDLDLRVATVVWDFDYDLIWSDICSSAYRTQSGDILINYATAESRQVARFVLVNDGKEVLYDASIQKRPDDFISCQTAYSIEEIALENMVVQ